VVVHGLKNCLIANNTWVLGSQAISGQQSYVWRHLYPGVNTDASVNSLVANNIIAAASSSDHYVELGDSGTPAGISSDYNLYSGPGQWSSGGSAQSFAAWKSAHAGWDQHSLDADALLIDPSEFNQTAAQKPVYDWSKAAPRAGSPAQGAGADQTSRFTGDFTGSARGAGAYDLGAVAAP
jgi:hypothetical protein